MTQECIPDRYQNQGINSQNFFSGRLSNSDDLYRLRCPAQKRNLGLVCQVLEVLARFWTVDRSYLSILLNLEMLLKATMGSKIYLWIENGLKDQNLNPFGIALSRTSVHIKFTPNSICLQLNCNACQEELLLVLDTI